MSKVCKKKVHRNLETTLPWALKKCPSSLYFTLLIMFNKCVIYYFHFLQSILNDLCKEYINPVFFINGTLMQIWKSANIFVFIWKYYFEGFILKHVLPFEICAHEICKKFVYKHPKTIEFKISLLLRTLQTSRANNSRILRIKNSKHSGYCFHMNTNV